MIDIAPFRSFHLDYMKPRSCYDDDPLIKERFLNSQSDPSVFLHTFLINGDPIAIIGGKMIFEHSGEIWGLTTDAIRDVPIAFLRQVRKMLEEYRKELNLWRYQMLVSVKLQERVLFAKALGFKKEGLLRKYGPSGDDYYMYGRIY